MDIQLIFSLVVGLPLAAVVAWFVWETMNHVQKEQKLNIQLGRPIVFGWDNPVVVTTDSGQVRYRPFHCPHCQSINPAFYDVNDFHTQKSVLNCKECDGKIAVTILLRGKNLEKITVEKAKNVA